MLQRAWTADRMSRGMKDTEWRVEYWKGEHGAGSRRRENWAFHGQKEAGHIILLYSVRFVRIHASRRREGIRRETGGGQAGSVTRLILRA